MSKVTMKQALERILDAHGILADFKSARHYAAKIESNGFMPLAIEKHGTTVTVTHYYEQNGDLVPDPDMEFVDLGGRELAPVAIQHCTGHYMRAAECVDGEWRFDQRRAQDLLEFAGMWAGNLMAQGFASGRLVRAGET
jgi:hypothetical protein